MFPLTAESWEAQMLAENAQKQAAVLRFVRRPDIGPREALEAARESGKLREQARSLQVLEARRSVTPNHDHFPQK